MLYYLITALHVVVCIILILVVLLQSGKGADLAGAFGGASTQTAFGSRGPASFLSKLTTISAVIFMLTCLSLTMIGGTQSSKSILETTPGAAAPPPKAPAVQQPQQAPAPTPEQIRKMQEEAEAKAKKQPAEAPKQPQTPPPPPKKQ